MSQEDSHSLISSTTRFLTLSGSFNANINKLGHRATTPSAPEDTLVNKKFQNSEVQETQFAQNGKDTNYTSSSEFTSSLPLRQIQPNGKQDIDEEVGNHSPSSVQEEEKKSDKKLKFSKMTARGKYTFILLAVANFGAGCGFSLPAPFFPREAEKKDVSATVIGLVFSSFQLVNFIACPLFGNYLTKIGAKFLYTSGILTAGTTAILFGFLDKSPPGTVFIAMSFLVRSVEALGVSAFSTASFAIISNEFPQHISAVFATLETCIGIGLMVGPTIGGAFYELAGFGTPFWFIGGVMISCGLLIYTCLPVPRDTSTSHEDSILTLLRSPMVWVSMLCVMSGSCGISFFDPTLSNHLDGFGLSTLVVGLFFVIVPGMHALIAPLWGYLSDTKDIQAPLLIGGNLVGAIGYLMIGPTPLLPFLPRELWTVTVGLVIYGSSIGCAIVPTMKCFVLGAGDLGFSDNLNTFGLVSGLFNSIFCLGAFIGPTIGGSLVDKIGFYYGATIIAGVHLVTMSIALIYFSIRRYCKKRQGYISLNLETVSQSNGEKSPLMATGTSPAF